MTEFRVEKKYLVSDLDLAVLSQRLSRVMERDEHQDGDCYVIRSLYFDDIVDNCMAENAAGVDRRSKYRIRIYDPKGSLIRLEIKEKQNGLTRKWGCPLLPQEYRRILEAPETMEFGDKPDLNRFLMQVRCRMLRPKAIICYERTAFTHPSGNVRVTFDRSIEASGQCGDLFDPELSDFVPVLPTGKQILEVKYDEFLPDMIARELETGRLQQTAFSKYYLGRMALMGQFPLGI